MTYPISPSLSPLRLRLGCQLPHRRSFVRWILAAAGLGILVAALAAAEDPYHRLRQFGQVMACEQSVGGCFAREQGLIVSRRTDTTTASDTGERITLYKITFQRADGSRQTHNVESDFYREARPGQPITLRIWEGEVVAAEVADELEEFPPTVGGEFQGWLILAHLGLGVMLWGLFFGWWDGFPLFSYRAFAWTFMSFYPSSVAVDALSHTLPPGPGLLVVLAIGVFFVGIPCLMLLPMLGGPGEWRTAPIVAMSPPSAPERRSHRDAPAAPFPCCACPCRHAGQPSRAPSPGDGGLVGLQVGQEGVVGLPAVGELDGDVEVDGVVDGVGVQQVGDAGAGDDHAGVAVPGGQHAQPARLQVEGGGVAAARQGVHHDDHLELPALEAVGGVDDDLLSARHAGAG